MCFVEQVKQSLQMCSKSLWPICFLIIIVISELIAAFKPVVCVLGSIQKKRGNIIPAFIDVASACSFKLLQRFFNLCFDLSLNLPDGKTIVQTVDGIVAFRKKSGRIDQAEQIHAIGSAITDGKIHSCWRISLLAAVEVMDIPLLIVFSEFAYGSSLSLIGDHAGKHTRHHFPRREYECLWHSFCIFIYAMQFVVRFRGRHPKEFFNTSLQNRVQNAFQSGVIAWDSVIPVNRISIKPKSVLLDLL